MFPLLLALNFTNSNVYVSEDSDPKSEVFIFACHIARSIDINSRLLGLKHHDITLYTRHLHGSATFTPVTEKM
jgi:hypothetical protein